MPGFVASVQTDVSIPIGLTHLYYICFLVGFAISASVYCLLHFVFPARMSEEFVKDGASAAFLMQEYRDRWEVSGINGVEMHLPEKV